ncbi:MAG: chemotaxis protein CheW [Chroococcus sp. CMT-3BRIN-NPC107]|jgi:purine-binding chemotaxis protein CheW|nr:chemotaxis protein CheW [Chroococcus sp. CMT-3BRIN-NPC107]
MKNKPYLIFSLHDLHYGIDSLLVQEILHLPELVSVVEAPKDIVGVLNLRGKIVPIMHLGLRLGNLSPQCSLNDSVIVLDYDGLQIGIIVSNVYEVKNIDESLIEKEIDYGRIKDVNSRFVEGIANFSNDTIILINYSSLLRDSQGIEALLREENNEQDLNTTSLINNFYTICCPQATPQEKVIFAERANNLRQSANNIDSQELISLAVVGLNNEYFGLDLKLVQEFTNVRNITPIPCCPSHVVGNMNLRGEILTLIDIRSILNMPLAKKIDGGKAIVVSVEDEVAGFPVDEVFDVMYLHPSAVNCLPIAGNFTNEEYFRGTVVYSGSILTVLDLPKLLTNKSLVVNEEI